MKTRLTRIQSPSAPAVTMKAANAIVYALTTHCSSDTPPPNNVPMLLSGVDDDDVELHHAVTEAHRSQR